MGQDMDSVYRSESDGLLRFAFLLCGDREVAEDAVADAIAMSLPKLKRGSVEDPGRYLRRAVANRLIDRRRKRDVIARGQRRVLVSEAAPLDQIVVERTVLADAIHALSSGQRAVIVCRFYESMSVAETAEVLRLPEGTVKSRMSRALEALSIILTEDIDTAGAQSGADANGLEQPDPQPAD